VLQAGWLGSRWMMVGFSVQAGIFILSTCPDRLRTPPSLVCCGYPEASSVRVKQTERVADHSTPS
jgi:hypothetical protein